MRRAATVVPLLATAALAAGCGTTSLTAGQLRSQASRVCTRTAARTERIPAPASPDQSERFLRAGLVAMRPAARELQRLEPPRELRESYRQAVKLEAQALALIARQERAIAQGQDAASAFRELQTALDPVVRIEDATWRGLQIPACVSR